MHIIYEEHPPRFTGRPTRYEDQPATRHYITHFGNVLFLQAVEAAPKSIQEKIQAGREMVIAQRKMEHWRRHPNFDQDEAARETDRLKKEWRR